MTADLSTFSGKRPVALITGAARRVGRVIALELAARGCDIVVHANTSLDEARQTADACRTRGGSATVWAADLGDTPALAHAAADLARQLPRLDVLVHNASAYAPSPLAEITPERALADFSVNALAPLILSKAFALLLTSCPLVSGGSIVAMADIHVLGRPRKDFVSYSMSKAALVQMVECLARDLAPKVRVNAVAPGVVAWPEQGYESDSSMQEAYLRRVPLARSGTPEDTAKAVAFLALDAAYTTGHILRLDGGRWLT